MHQELGAAKETISRIQEVAGHLDHPSLVRINTNASDVNDASLQFDDEENHVPDGAEGAKGFNAEEIAGV